MLTEEDEQDRDQAGLTGLVWPNGLTGRLQPSHRQFVKAMATRKPVPQIEGARGLMASSKTIRRASQTSGSKEAVVTKGIYDPDTGKPIITEVATMDEKKAAAMSALDLNYDRVYRRKLKTLRL